MAADNRSNFFSRLFGFRFANEAEPKTPSPVAPNPNDGSVMIGAPGPNWLYGGAPGPKRDETLSEQQLITRYRDMALHPLVDWAIDEIVNESIVQDGETPAVTLDLSACTAVPAEARVMIEKEFEQVLNLLNWNSEAYQMFRNWYVDGRLYYQILVDDNLREEGIRELRFIDPRQIRKFIEVDEKKDPITGLVWKDLVDEYFVYSQWGIEYNGGAILSAGKNPSINGIRLTKDSVAFIHSGIFDSTSSIILSYLHKAIRGLSQLKSIENATIIYKISRAPERRVWKIPTGQMPEKQVKTYLDQVVSQYRTRMAFDALTGDVIDERRVLSIIDDIFIPIPSSGESVQVETIPGGSGFDDTNSIEYFNKQLLRALNVPASRLNTEMSSLFGNTGTTTRDELKFAKMIHRLRKQFSLLFDTLLKTQLRLKGIIQSEADWDYLSTNWEYKFATDNHYSELSEAQVWQSRFQMAMEAAPFIGKYVSNAWVRKHVFKLTDQEQLEINEQISEEIQTGEIQLAPPEGAEGGEQGAPEEEEEDAEQDEPTPN